MRRRAPWILGAASTLLAAVSLALAIDDPETLDGGVGMAVFQLVAFSALAAIGALVATRQPANPVGWILCTTPLLFGFGNAGESVYRAGGSAAFEWVANWTWVPAIVPALGLVPLLFPTGGPPGPRWRWAGRATVVGGTLILLGFMLTPGAMQDTGVVNPMGIDGLRAPLDALTSVGFLLTAVGVLSAAGSLVHRFRRSQGLERLQLKWVVTALVLYALFWAVMVVGGLVASNVDDGDVGWVLLVTGQLALASAIAVATLRHRLYDVDVVIRRTLVYTSLTAALAATYLGSVLLLQLVLPDRSGLAVAASTLAVAAAVRPVRSRIQAGVDRRFFRRRYDAERTLMRFGLHVRETVSLDALDAELRTVVAETMQPAHVSLWLRPRP